jgi:hypothetical protein
MGDRLAAALSASLLSPLTMLMTAHAMPISVSINPAQSRNHCSPSDHRSTGPTWLTMLPLQAISTAAMTQRPLMNLARSRCLIFQEASSPPQAEPTDRT